MRAIGSWDFASLSLSLSGIDQAISNLADLQKDKENRLQYQDLINILRGVRLVVRADLKVSLCMQSEKIRTKAEKGDLVCQ